jgi:hypothetical protein
VKAQTALIDDQVTPDPRDELAFANNFWGALHERDEEIQSSATELQWNTVFLQDSLACP